MFSGFLVFTPNNLKLHAFLQLRIRTFDMMEQITNIAHTKKQVAVFKLLNWKVPFSFSNWNNSKEAY